MSRSLFERFRQRRIYLFTRSDTFERFIELFADKSVKVFKHIFVVQKVVSEYLFEFFVLDKRRKHYIYEQAL